MFFQLSDPAPVTRELIAAIGDQPAVSVTFRPQPSPLSLREARTAAWKILREGGPDAEEIAADAFSRSIIRHNMLSWSGIYDGDRELQPTPDRETRDEEGTVIEIIPGTISGFLAEPRLMLAADREYVVPWSLRDAEKNGLAVSPSGTLAAETAAEDTASGSATSDETADATSAPTSSTNPEPTKAKRSGSSSRRSGRKPG